jgi:Uma2 family endonuclease
MLETATGQGVKRHRFTVNEYRLMGEAGIFGEDDRVELIDGEVVEMSPIGWRHAWCVRAVARLLVRVAEERTARGERFEVDVQNPLYVHEYGEPQPDLVLLKGSSIGRLPGPEDVALVVEVADTTLQSTTATSRSRSTPGRAYPRPGSSTSTPTG